MPDNSRLITPIGEPSAGVTILGAGVSGLTTALVLGTHRPAWRVRVLADRIGADSSSSVAGAIWFPFKVGGSRSEIRDWARATYLWLRERSAEVGTGVGPALPMYIASTSTARPDWLTALPPNVEPRWVQPPQMPALLRQHALRTPQHGVVRGAWRFLTHVVEPRPHLDWLLGRLAQIGVAVETIDTVGDLQSVPGVGPNEVLVNATGRRASPLTSDAKLEPARGQVVIANDAHIPRGAAFADTRDESALFYLVPRREGVVLGGCNLASDPSEEHAWASPARPPTQDELKERILDRFRAAGLRDVHEIVDLAEYRPVRIDGEVRVARDDVLENVVHHYGHGGSGFTLSYGSAFAVMNRIESIVSEAPPSASADAADT